MILKIRIILIDDINIEMKYLRDYNSKRWTAHCVVCVNKVSVILNQRQKFELI